MFDPPSRLDLQERLGYERYVLHKCEQLVKKAYGFESGTEVTIKDAPPHPVTIGFEDHIGAGLVSEFIQDTSPLLFTAAFKILDMVIEWTILENLGSCPWKFSQKRQVINTNPTLIFPDFLHTDGSLKAILLALYSNLAEDRNAIIHGEWGTNSNGNLSFDYTVKFNNAHIQKTVSFQEVLDFAAFATLLGETLVATSLQTPYRLDTMRWLGDRIHSLHGAAKSNILHPMILKVKRETDWKAPGPVEVNLSDIRTFLARMHSTRTTFFDLSVEATTESGQAHWSIPAEHVPAGDTLVLDNNWSQYRAALPSATHAPSNSPSSNPRWVKNESSRSLTLSQIIWPIVLLALGFLLGYLIK